MKREAYEGWIRRNAARMGLTPEALRRGFPAPPSEVPPDAPFEVPEKMEVTYRYSYGGQSRFFRTLRDEGRLLGSRCPSCARVYCPPRKDCPRCYQPTSWVPLSGTGVVVTFTVVHVTTSPFVRKVPFLVAYVRLDGTQFLFPCNVEMENVERASVGMRVRARFRPEREGRITDLYFVPA